MTVFFKLSVNKVYIESNRRFEALNFMQSNLNT